MAFFRKLRWVSLCLEGSSVNARRVRSILKHHVRNLLGRRSLRLIRFTTIYALRTEGSHLRCDRSADFATPTGRSYSSPIADELARNE